ncbi:hypothetical protein M231_01988 [Tremella mesenterica]|uniref:F-box domain-containing protein n=1 Tax=Tremella mesenterica TaxID=5217 RepID=A0A4Q1BRY1_TREME|nr:hypothetical protein M231_01988 [Tremella mesenterica]
MSPHSSTPDASNITIGTLLRLVRPNVFRRSAKMLKRLKNLTRCSKSKRADHLFHRRSHSHGGFENDFGLGHTDVNEMMGKFKLLSKGQRFAFLSTLVPELLLPEALVVARRIDPRLKRDFLKDLPLELSLHCLSFVEDARTLARASQVSQYWYALLQDETTWKHMCTRTRFFPLVSPFPSHSSHSRTSRRFDNPFVSRVPHSNLRLQMGRVSLNPLAQNFITTPRFARLAELGSVRPMSPPTTPRSFKQQFKDAYLTESNWLTGGQLIASHKHTDDGVVTSLAIDDTFIVVGMANSQIEVYDSRTGAWLNSLKGHEAGVWALMLVSPHRRPPPTPPIPQEQSYVTPQDLHSNSLTSPSTYREEGRSRRASFTAATSQSARHAPTGGPSSRGIQRPNTTLGVGEENNRSGTYTGKKPVQSDLCGAAMGYGSDKHLVVSGGCDRNVRVWDANTGQCLHVLRGHSSTVRCLKVIDGKPLAITGSRDWTLRVWDIERGRCVHILQGHQQSVRCVEVAGNIAATGSYDFTCRLWNVETGQCLRVLVGHYHQIYAIAFDGERVVTGSLDSTVRVWDAATGTCMALLQGHTSLVGQLQLTSDTLVTGGSDGRVIIFDLTTLTCLHRLCAHDNSVTCLQFDDRYIISGGNDGRVKLWDMRTGAFIRELTRRCDAVWRVNFRDDRCVILLQRGGRTVLEVLSFRAGEKGGERITT